MSYVSKEQLPQPNPNLAPTAICPAIFTSGALTQFKRQSGLRANVVETHEWINDQLKDGESVLSAQKQTVLTEIQRSPESGTELHWTLKASLNFFPLLVLRLVRY